MTFAKKKLITLRLVPQSLGEKKGIIPSLGVIVDTERRRHKRNTLASASSSVLSPTAAQTHTSSHVETGAENSDF